MIDTNAVTQLDNCFENNLDDVLYCTLSDCRSF